MTKIYLIKNKNRNSFILKKKKKKKKLVTDPRRYRVSSQDPHGCPGSREPGFVPIPRL
jgi:hypothetical protein